MRQRQVKCYTSKLFSYASSCILPTLITNYAPLANLYLFATISILSLRCVLCESKQTQLTVKMSTSNYTLKVNIRAQEERERREKEKAARDSLIKVVSSGPVVRPRKRKALQFNEPGKYISEGEQLRKKARLEELKKRIAAKSAQTGVSDAVKLATLTNKTTTTNKTDKKAAKLIEQDEHVPDIEWWDKILLKNKSLEEAILKLDQNVNPEQIFDGITNLIEHPSIKKRNLDNEIPVPIYLTKKERDKLRRQNRRTRQLEEQQNIKLGLAPKPETKLKGSSIRHTLSLEAIVNPSKAEQMVKEQVEKRQKAHLEHNSAKKLTGKEKKEKKNKKMQEDLSVVGTWLSVYKILNLSYLSHRLKVTNNAKQRFMTGMLVECKDSRYQDINIVVVEGGPIQQRKYKHLMLNRINWNEDPLVAANSEEGNALKDNKCSLLWEGKVTARSFSKFEEKTVRNVEEAKELFKKFHFEQYWDLAFNMNILDSLPEKVT